MRILLIFVLMFAFICGGCQSKWVNCSDPTCSICSGKGSTKCTHCTDGDRREETCRACNGQGFTVCLRCQGGGLCTICGGHGNLGPCTVCGGKGNIVEPYSTRTCEKCQGTGVVNCEACAPNILGVIGKGTGHCPICDGKGKPICEKCTNGKIVSYCRFCNGKIYIPCPNGHYQ